MEMEGALSVFLGSATSKKMKAPDSISGAYGFLGSQVIKVNITHFLR